MKKGRRAVAEETKDRIRWYVAKLLYDELKAKGKFPKLEVMAEKLREQFDRHFHLPEVSRLKGEVLQGDKYLRADLMPRKNEELQSDLLAKFESHGLRKTVVVDQYVGRLNEALGKEAALFFDENVPPRGKRKEVRVTVSCGTTIYAMIQNLRGRYSGKLRVFSSIILAIEFLQQISPVSVVDAFTTRFPGVQATAFQLPPELVQFRDMRERAGIYMKLKKAHFNKVIKSEWFFLGIGALSKRPKAGLTGEFNRIVKQFDCYDDFKERECVGEISFWPIKADGKELYEGRAREKSEFFKHVYTLDFNELREKRGKKATVVAVAGGPRKVIAIHSCLKMRNIIDSYS